MVVIRLARVGRHKYPVYRIVAADKKRATTSKFLAILGTYNPHTKEVSLKKELILEYLKNGAQASDRVLRILMAQGVELPKWAQTHDRNKKPKGEQPEEAKEPAKADDEQGTIGAEVATESTAEKEEVAKQQKEDLGTQKELQDKDEQKEATEKVASAVDKSEKK